MGVAEGLLNSRSTKMRSIHFDNLGKQRYWIILLILSLCFILIGFVEPGKYDSIIDYKYFSAAGYLILVIYLSKAFWFRNTVQWNKKGMLIRIKSFLGKSIRFDKIKNTELVVDTLEITKTDGEKIKIDVTGIVASDVQKLKEIVIKNSEANFIRI